MRGEMSAAHFVEKVCKKDGGKFQAKSYLERPLLRMCNKTSKIRPFPRSAAHGDLIEPDTYGVPTNRM